MTHKQFRDMLLTAWMQVRIAVALYVGRQALETLAKSCNARMRYVEVAYLSVGVLIFDDHAHVTICGSNDLHDWAQNLTAKQKDIGGFEGHAGFIDSARLVHTALKCSGILADIGQLPLVLGGHSAGGAVAQAMSLLPRLEPRELVTFGCPRIFSSKSAAFYSSLHWYVRRFVMSGDPVPRLPLRKFRALFGKATYAHTSAPITVTDAGEIALEQESSLVRSVISWAIRVWTCGITTVSILFGRLPKLLANHSVHRYHDAIENAVKELGK